ncbi:MAG: redoxin domain-containing protein [Gammaproteobacteria bacterium]
MKRAGIISIIVLAVLVAGGAIAYTNVPVVRYFLMPITGSTQAPQSLLGGSDEQNAQDMEKKHGMPQQVFANRTQTVASIEQVPAEGGWINSKPLDLKKLEKEGNVILVDFWTYTCINCIRANPFDEVYWQRYKDHGLVIIGVASPEFAIEGVPKNVLIGVNREGLTYPILMDANMKVWSNFGNHFWPGKYLIDPHGDIVYHKFGEGDYEAEESEIRKQLIKAGHTDLPPDTPLAPKLNLIPAARYQTGELYAGPGFLRKPLGNNQQPQAGETTDFKLPATLDEDHIYLGGQWKGANDYDESVGEGVIGLNYIAQAPYVVLDTAGGAKKVEVTLDGKPLPPEFRGTDITVADGKTWMNVTEPRLYWPIANRAPYGRHTIRFMVPAGVRLYSFTFGTYLPPGSSG